MIILEFFQEKSSKTSRLTLRGHLNEVVLRGDVRVRGEDECARAAAEE